MMKMKILLLFSVSILLFAGCTKEYQYNDYSYVEEEESKYQVDDVALKEDEPSKQGIVTSPINFNASISSINGELYNGNCFMFYNYEMLLDKAYVYFATSYNCYFENMMFSIALYDENEEQIDTVYTEPVNCVGTFPVKVYFTSYSDVEYVQILSASFTSSNDNLKLSGNCSFESTFKDPVKWDRLSNTTFKYKADANYLVMFLDKNGVQVDCNILTKGKGRVVTVQDVEQYRLALIEEE